MAPLTAPGTSPRALETVAVRGDRPAASSTGNVTSVPEPDGVQGARADAGREHAEHLERCHTTPPVAAGASGGESRRAGAGEMFIRAR